MREGNTRPRCPNASRASAGTAAAGHEVGSFVATAHMVGRGCRCPLDKEERLLWSCASKGRKKSPSAGGHRGRQSIVAEEGVIAVSGGIPARTGRHGNLTSGTPLLPGTRASGASMAPSRGPLSSGGGARARATQIPAARPGRHANWFPARAAAATARARATSR